MTPYLEIDTCPITQSRKKLNYFNLGNFPLVNNLADCREDSLNCDRYPLEINYFPESGLTALTHAVNGDILFKNYLFKSGVNIPYIRHCEKILTHAEQYVTLDSTSFIVDIGGNDGTLLSTFKEALPFNVRVLNIDPSENLVDLNKTKGIDVLTEFFNKETAAKVETQADIITSTNVFQHLYDINSFTEGIKALLKPNGIWVLEFPYWIHDLKTNQFDQIYHEHVYYYSVKPLINLFSKYGLRIVNAEEQAIHGGTLRLTVVHKDAKYPTDITVDKFLREEAQYGIEYYSNWGDQVINHLAKCSAYLRDLKDDGKKIVAFGAAAKGCIFLNSIHANFNTVDYIIDDTDIKQGKYVPGTGIQVVSREILQASKPDYILILAHNFTGHIMTSLIRENSYTGKFLTLLPTIQEYASV